MAHLRDTRSGRLARFLVGAAVAAVTGLHPAASQPIPSPPPPPPPSAARGELVAERLCRYCHQIRPGTSSDVEAQAPAFTRIANTAGRDAAFLRGFASELHLVRTIGNPPVVMPTAVLTAEAREDVIAYILTFKR